MTHHMACLCQIMHTKASGSCAVYVCYALFLALNTLDLVCGRSTLTCNQQGRVRHPWRQARVGAPLLCKCQGLLVVPLFQGAPDLVGQPVWVHAKGQRWYGPFGDGWHPRHGGGAWCWCWTAGVVVGCSVSEVFSGCGGVVDHGSVVLALWGLHAEGCTVCWSRH